MPWIVDYEKMRAIESASGEHADEALALAELASNLHVLRDDVRSKLADKLDPMTRIQLRHGLPRLAAALARCQRRRRDLGVKAPPCWETP